MLVVSRCQHASRGSERFPSDDGWPPRISCREGYFSTNRTGFRTHKFLFVLILHVPVNKFSGMSGRVFMC